MLLINRGERDLCQPVTYAATGFKKIKVRFCEEGPLGVFITDTEDGRVVINGEAEHAYELDPRGTAAKYGLQKLDQIMKVNGTSVMGQNAEAVKQVVGSGARPLELELLRVLVVDW